MVRDTEYSIHCDSTLIYISEYWTMIQFFCWQNETHFITERFSSVTWQCKLYGSYTMQVPTGKPVCPVLHSMLSVESFTVFIHGIGVFGYEGVWIISSTYTPYHPDMACNHSIFDTSCKLPSLTMHIWIEWQTQDSTRSRRSTLCFTSMPESLWDLSKHLACWRAGWRVFDSRFKTFGPINKHPAYQFPGNRMIGCSFTLHFSFYSDLIYGRLLPPELPSHQDCNELNHGHLVVVDPSMTTSPQAINCHIDSTRTQSHNTESYKSSIDHCRF